MLANQTKLPRLPVPPLADTCKRFLHTVEPLLSAEQMARARELVNDFASTVGPRLQRMLQLYDSGALTLNSSYLESLWYDGYLDARCPTPVNITPFFVFTPPSKPVDRFTRAAALVRGMLHMHVMVSSERLEPDMERGKVPLCMKQYPWLFATARKPGLLRDTYVKSHDARHIAVLVRNHVFTFDVMDRHGNVLDEAHIRATLEAIVTGVASDAPAFGAQTGQNRARWAIARAHAEQHSQRSAHAFRMMDSAIFAVAFDSTNNAGGALCQQLLHNEGVNRWFDKTLQLVVLPDATSALLLEHSMSDGHSILRVVTETIDYVDGKTSPLPSYAATPAVTELVFELDADLRANIEAAQRELVDIRDSLECTILDFAHFGKNEVTKLKASPDALCQVAYQVTHIRMHGKAVGTYESCMTKQFLGGRTEVIRSASVENAALVKTLAASPSKQQLQMHLEKGRLAKDGLGVDRHLMVLRVIGEQAGITHPLFADASYKQLCRSEVSTSNCGTEALCTFGFGPVVDNGYGIGYIIKNNSLHFCVTSFGPKAAAFARALESTLLELRDVLAGAPPQQQPAARL